MSFVTRYVARLSFYYSSCCLSFTWNSSSAFANSSGISTRHFAMKSPKNCFSLQDTVRLGIMLLIAIDVLTLVVEGARSSHDYPNVPKPRSKPREIRGFKPASMSTAIGFGKREGRTFHAIKLDRHNTMMLVPPSLSTARGFGKRGNSVLQPSKPYRHDTPMILTPIDVPHRFPIEHLVQLLNVKPELARALRKYLLSDDENVRASVGQRYKKTPSDIIDYFDE